MAVRELEQMAGIKVPDRRNRISLFHAADRLSPPPSGIKGSTDRVY